MNNLDTSFPVMVSARHMDCTDSIRNYIKTKLARLKFSYPRILDAEVVVDHHRHGESINMKLNCTNHVVLDAHTETRDLYEAIDLAVAKIGRQMRKEKTRRLKKLHRVDNR